MKRLHLFAILAAVALGLMSARSARAESIHERLIEAQADTIVSVKYVVSMRFSGGGRSSESENSGTITGVVIDPVGLIVVSSRALAPSSRFGSFEITATPLSLRVIFPGDPKEYDAVLGATDSRLGLSFLRIKDLEGREIRAIDRANTAEPTVGMEAYGVSRLAQGFDYAPYCDTVSLAGYVTKPRKMWLLRGRFSLAAHPLFNTEGALLGFVSVQEAVGEGGRRSFLLPLKVVESTIKRASRETERVLEEALEREAEEKEEAAAAKEEGGADDDSPEEDAPEEDAPEEDDGDDDSPEEDDGE